jgi:hypothetical protein
MSQGDYIPYIVTKPNERSDAIEVERGEEGAAHFDMGPLAYEPGNLHVRYWYKSNVLWVLDESKAALKPGGEHHEQFAVLYNYLASEWPRFGPDTRYSVGPSGPGSKSEVGGGRVGDLFPPRKERTYAPIPTEQSIEGFYPSGRPIRLGDRRPVKVRSHLRRRIAHHLDNPPSYCACNYSKTADNVRRRIARRLR